MLKNQYKARLESSTKSFVNDRKRLKSIRSISKNLEKSRLDCSDFDKLIKIQKKSLLKNPFLVNNKVRKERAVRKNEVGMTRD